MASTKNKEDDHSYGNKYSTPTAISIDSHRKETMPMTAFTSGQKEIHIFKLSQYFFLKEEEDT